MTTLKETPPTLLLSHSRRLFKGQKSMLLLSKLATTLYMRWPLTSNHVTTGKLGFYLCTKQRKTIEKQIIPVTVSTVSTLSPTILTPLLPPSP